MSLLGTLIGDVLNGSVQLLDDLTSNTGLLDSLDTDLGGQLDEVYSGLLGSQDTISTLVDSLNGGAGVDAIAEPLQSLQDALTTLSSSLTGIDTSSVNALRDAIDGLTADFGSLAESVSQGLTTAEALSILSPVTEDLGILNDSLVPGLLIDEAVGDVLDTLLGNTTLLDEISSDLGDLAEPVAQAIEPLTSKLETALNDFSNGTISPEALADELNTMIDGLQGTIDSLTGNSSPEVTQLVDGLQDLVDDLSTTAADILDGTTPLQTEIIRVLEPVVVVLKEVVTVLPGVDDPNNNTFNGTEKNETIKTTAKQDVFDMKGGRDVVISTIENLKQVDSLIGGEGIDMLVLQQGGSKDVLKLRMATESDPNNLVSSELPDSTVISGFEGFNGQAFKGRTILKGSSEQDEMHGGKGGDKFSGQKGHDFMSSNNGKDSLNGGIGNDSLLGGNAADTMIGGEGDDLLTGGRGRDKMKTGKGKDQITFDSIKDRGDRIVDFDKRKDSLVFSRSGFSKDMREGDLKRSQFVLDGKPDSKGACFMYNQEKGALLFDADGSGNDKAITIGKFTNEVGLSAKNFTIV